MVKVIEAHRGKIVPTKLVTKKGKEEEARERYLTMLLLNGADKNRDTENY